MPGLINSVPALQNPLLRKTEQQIEAQLTGRDRENYLKIVVAGMKAGLAKGPQGILAGLKGRPDPLQDCAVGAVNIVLMLHRISRGTMPAKPMVPAAMALMLQALDFSDSAGIVKVGNDELVRATKTFTDRIFQAFGITMPMLNRAAAIAHGVTMDPEQMAAMKQQMPQEPQAQSEGEA